MALGVGGCVPSAAGTVRCLPKRASNFTAHKARVTPALTTAATTQ
ncbi:MAG: hypothetical protein BWX70_03482 [Verrucomicrobia bacterium ADurb.Bin070]|nr:MAG: hypothetical protein BWX70_03482 [Verrucomicrobia bacterium ADurb.Bin070]